MGAQKVLEGGVHQVRGRMGATNSGPARIIHFCEHVLPEVNRAFTQVTDMEHEGPFPFGITNLKSHAWRNEPAAIAHLSAPFSVKRCTIQNDRNSIGMADLSQ